jgi:hypothetical protein
VAGIQDPLQTGLEQIVFNTPWLVGALHAVRTAGPPNAYVGAGAIRNVVWDALHGAQCVQHPNDIDVVYFQHDERATVDWASQLRLALPSLRWDVTNQALIHHWQSRQLGRPVSPYASLGAAIASWPETATAVAARLQQDDTLSLIAPYGLADLFQMHVRPSPGLTDPSVFHARLESKQWRTRWPQLTVQFPRRD